MITKFRLYEMYQKLSKFDTEILKEYITPVIKETIDNKMKSLTIQDYEIHEFSYEYMIEDFFGKDFWTPKLYSFAKENLGGTTPAVHNSFMEILDDYCKEHQIYTKLSNLLIDLFEKNPNIYIKNYSDNEEYMEEYVKDKLEYLLAAKPYNL